jgi:hypothetical protein
LQAVYGHIRSPTTCDIVFGKVLSHLPIFSAKNIWSSLLFYSNVSRACEILAQRI